MDIPGVDNYVASSKSLEHACRHNPISCFLLLVSSIQGFSSESGWWVKGQAEPILMQEVKKPFSCTFDRVK